MPQALKMEKPLEIVEIKLENLSEEAFAPYGTIMSPKQPIYPHVDSDEGRVAIEVSRLAPSWRRDHLDEMAVHFTYNQAFIMMQGSMILVVAPAPLNRESAVDDYDIQYDKLKAFMVEMGDGVMIDAGIWHNNIPMGAVTYANVTRKDPGEGTTRTPPAGKTPKDRKYVGGLDIAKRDNKIIKVVF